MVIIGGFWNSLHQPYLTSPCRIRAHSGLCFGKNRGGILTGVETMSTLMEKSFLWGYFNGIFVIWPFKKCFLLFFQ